MKIGVYCGSFNPVHKGHIKIARECVKQHLVDKVLIIATGNYWDKSIEISLQDRINMLKLYQSKQIEIEEELNGLQYTYMIFQELKKANPNNEYNLIIGADNLENFEKWKRYKYLLKNGLIIVKRDDMDDEYIHQEMVELKSSNYKILNIEPIDANSTYIRQNLDDYKKIKGMLDKKVYDYLKRDWKIFLFYKEFI